MKTKSEKVILLQRFSLTILFLLPRSWFGEEITLRFSTNGLLSVCTTFDTTCADDCAQGISIEELRGGP
jgi:hypothetical protein